MRDIAPAAPAMRAQCQRGRVDDGLPCGVISYADSGEVLSWNPGLLGMLGLDLSQAPPARFADLLTPASRILYLSGLWPKLQLQQWVEESYLTLRTAGGADVPVLVNIRREAAPGEHARNVAVLVHIRDRKRLEDELLRARRATEQVPGLVCQIMRTPAGHSSIPFASDAIQSLFDVTPAQAKHSAAPLRERVHVDDREALRRSLARSAGQLSAWHHQFRVEVRGVTRWIEGRGAPQRLSDGTLLWHAYLCDVTERHATEALARDKAVAEEASRAKSAFLARISHELRTPLNAVLGFAQLLAADSALAALPRQREQVRHIETAGHSLLALVNEVLDLTRIESGTVALQLQPCEVSKAMQSSATLVALLAEQQGVTLSVQDAPALVVRADPAKLAQCLVNLLSNAIKYNRPGGTVQLRAVVVGTQVHLEVHDTGPGLTPEQMAHLFEPFNRLGADRSGVEGSGLGLVITRALVRRMGGDLQVHSEPGQGSCFALALPAAAPERAPGATTALRPPDFLAAAADAAVADAAVPTAPPTAPSALPRAALYVDDNPVNLLLMQAMVDLCPALTLYTAASGAEALQLAQSQAVGLLLVDIGLPDIHGLELLARLRALPGLAQVPAVAVSADAMAVDVDRALAAGFNAYWTKPLDLARTQAMLAAWVRDEDPFSPGRSSPG